LHNLILTLQAVNLPKKGRIIMKYLLGWRPLWLLILYIILDAICIGMGMGVPFFCILLGFGVGWFLVSYTSSRVRDVTRVLREVLRNCLLATGITLLAMLALWVPFTSYLFDPAKDLANSGIPMILYEPLPSFIGWIVLMVLISPFLQLLTSLFTAYLALMRWMATSVYDQKAV
jgi:hypothetical protein